MTTTAVVAAREADRPQVNLQSFSLYTTAMTMEEARDQHQLVRKFVSDLLTPEIDYGVIPGTGKKPVLLKPGAEHLCQLFRLRPEFRALTVTEDFDKGLFFYRYACDLIHVPSGAVVGSGVGSCSTWESKYRYRDGKRLCPVCGKEAIIKGKAEFGGGWLCFGKKGGCGTKWKDGDQAIEGQSIEQVENDKIIDQVNTVDKMAQKRALIASTLITCGVSEFFTQDIEDGIEPPSERAQAKEDLFAKRTLLREMILEAADLSGKDETYCLRRFTGGEKDTLDDIDAAPEAYLKKALTAGAKLLDKLRSEALARDAQEAEAHNG